MARPTHPSTQSPILDLDADLDRILDLLDRPIAFHRTFVDVAGSVTAGLMLSQAFYWTRIKLRDNPESDGWFYKTQEEWEEETALKRPEQERARGRLRLLPFWHEERRGIPARMYFRLDLKALEAVLLGDTQAPCTVETIIANDAPYLRSLAKSAYMRCRKAGIEAEHVNYVVVLRTKGMICGICGQPTTRPPGQRSGSLSFDHIVPLNVGGTHTFDNVQPAHSDCNYHKGDRSENSQQTLQIAYRKPTSSLPQSTLVVLPEADKYASPKHTITETTAETTLAESTAQIEHNVDTNVECDRAEARRELRLTPREQEVVEVLEEQFRDTHSRAAFCVVVKRLGDDIALRLMHETCDKEREIKGPLGAYFIGTCKNVAKEQGIDLGFSRAYIREDM